MNCNPYEKGTVSHKIYERNYINPSELINSASDKDKFMIYMYVMGRSIKKISKFMGCSVTTVSNRLTKYKVKI